MTLSLLRLSSEEIVFENYEDEMVLLNLPAGVYYTLDPVGAQCLLVLLSAASCDAALHALYGRFSSPPEEVRDGVLQLSKLLADAELVVSRSDTEPGLAVEAMASGPVQTYSSSRLEKYEDIEDLLKFDPVHEVAKTGWPNVLDDKGGAS